MARHYLRFVTMPRDDDDQTVDVDFVSHSFTPTFVRPSIAFGSTPALFCVLSSFYISPVFTIFPRFEKCIRYLIDAELDAPGSYNAYQASGDGASAIVPNDTVGHRGADIAAELMVSQLLLL